MDDINVRLPAGAWRSGSTPPSARPRVLMPFGGRHQLHPGPGHGGQAARAAAAGDRRRLSVMAWGFDPVPYRRRPLPRAPIWPCSTPWPSSWPPAASGSELAYLTFQEYFEKLREDPERWGKPFAALLGALHGPDGSRGRRHRRQGLHVRLLRGFGRAAHARVLRHGYRQYRPAVTSPELQGGGRQPHLGLPPRMRWRRARLRDLRRGASTSSGAGIVRACASGAYGGLAETLVKAAVGNGLGITVDEDIDMGQLFEPAYGTFVIELAAARMPSPSSRAGRRRTRRQRGCGGAWPSDQRLRADLRRPGGRSRRGCRRPGSAEAGWKACSRTAPRRKSAQRPRRCPPSASKGRRPRPHGPALLGDTSGAPRVVIPVFPGTNCEYDTAAAFERAGAVPTVVRGEQSDARGRGRVHRRTGDGLIRASQIVMIPGGFSGGDEPDGSAQVHHRLLPQRPK